jgi:undecaprenyl diphosphate synthase
MSLLVSTINSETDTLLKNGVCLKTIGDMESLPSGVATKLKEAIAKTSGCNGLNLVLALNYSSRWEITNAITKIAQSVADGKLLPSDITAETVSASLCTGGIPDPELIIRTSGEYRLSNFLLWQAAYSEFYFTEVLWPDFDKEEFYRAVIDYQKRERRFGKISEQL